MGLTQYQDIGYITNREKLGKTNTLFVDYLYHERGDLNE